MRYFDTDDDIDFVLTDKSDFNIHDKVLICQSIVAEPESDLSLDDWSKRIFVSKYYLVRKFRDEIGLTPHNFLVQNRIRKAKKLLGENMLLTDVASECGFFDQSHFIKAFKSIVGVTPKEYVKSIIRIN